MRKKKGNIWLWIFIFICALVVLFIAVHLSNSYDRINKQANMNVFDLINDFTDAIEKEPFAIEYSQSTLKIAGMMMFFYIVIVMYIITNKHNFLAGKEHGSAEWEKTQAMKELMDNRFSKNILFTKSERMSIDGRETKKNMNVLVVGGSGSGKTRYFLKPNLMQLHSSYVVTDPKGEILRSCGKLLVDSGYKLKIVNLFNMQASDGYNPFEYLRKDKDEDVMTLITTLMINTNADKTTTSTDPFWEKAEQLFLQAIFFYILNELPKNEQNIPTALKLIRMADIREDSDTYESDLDLLFKLLEKEKGSEHIAVVQYKHFKVASGKTAKSIIISASARLAPFNIGALAKMSMKDELELSKMGEEKIALFMIIPPTNTTFNFIASMIYTQLFAELDYSANWKHNGTLPVPVRFLLDEFANIGKIPNFEKILAYARSLNIGISPIFQSLSQLKEMYKDSWETIVDNCDSFLFLGGQGEGTLEYISKKLGKATIDSKASGRTRGKQGSSSINISSLGRELMTPDEIAQMPPTDCILFIKGMHPFYSKKYILEKHPNYRFTQDYSEDNAYTCEKKDGDMLSADNLVQRYSTKDMYDELEAALNSKDFDTSKLMKGL